MGFRDFRHRSQAQAPLSIQLVLVLSFSLLAGMAACRSNTETATGTSSDASGEILAVVNGISISQEAFEKQMNDVANYRSSRLFTDEQKRMLLLDMINFELVLQEAVKNKFYLQNDNVRKTVVAEYLRDRVNNQAVPTDKEIEEFYSKNKVQFDSICVRHILVSTEKYDEATAMQKAKNLLLRLDKGEDFLIMADSESDDPGSKGFGGDLGCFNRKKEFVPEFIEGSFSLKKVGEYTKQPVKSRFGLHIILLTRDLRGKESNFEVIKRQLTIEKNKSLYDDYMNKIREAAKAEIHFDKLANINLQIGAPTATTAPGKK